MKKSILSQIMKKIWNKKFVGIKFFFLRNVLVNGPLIDRMWYEWQKKHRFENVWVVVK